MKKDAMIFDCDEVLLDHIGGLRKFVAQHYDINTSTDYPSNYDLIDWLGVSQTEVNEILKHFNENSYEFGLLEPFEPNTVQLMKKIRSNYKDVHIAVLTKSGTHGHGEVLRKVNLINVFGADLFDEIIIVEMYESKKSTLYKLKNKYNVKFLVDDYIKNIEAAVDLGIHGIMMAASHNTEYEKATNFEYVNNWYCLDQSIKRIMKSNFLL